MGETDFQWNEPNEELIKRTFSALGKYLTQGESRHVLDQMPKEINVFLHEVLESR